MLLVYADLQQTTVLLSDWTIGGKEFYLPGAYLLAFLVLFVGLEFRDYLLCVFPIDLEETPPAPPYSSYSHHLNVNRLSGGGLNHGRRLVLGARFEFVFPWFNGVRKPATIGIGAPRRGRLHKQKVEVRFQ